MKRKYHYPLLFLFSRDETNTTLTIHKIPLIPPLPKGEIVIPLFGKGFDEAHHPELVEGEGRGEIF